MWQYKRDVRALADMTGIVVDGENPEFSEDRLEIRWNGFALSQDGSEISIRLPSLLEDKQATLSLRPSAPWLAERSENLHEQFGSAFAYLSCPRLQAEGTVQGQLLQGRLWLDRQWGEYDGWFLQHHSGQVRLFRWEWFGLVLDDGRELIFQRHHVEASQVTFASFVVLFEHGTVTKLDGTFEALPLRSWRSPATQADYPVSWHLKVPELNLQLNVTPLVDDQEIPIFGAGAIWQGAVAVSGFQGERALSGAGRLELVGYAAVTSLGELINRRFRAVFPRPAKS
jgi:predicted secreted hydrolase